MQADAAGAGRNQAFNLGGFLADHEAVIRYDLSASECQPFSLVSLLEDATPEHLALWSSLAFGYAHPQGARDLRTAIAGRYRTIEPGQVLCCAGAQEALACVTQALLEPEDHAIVVVPIYQPSEWAATSRCAVSGVPLEPDAQWGLDVDRVARAIRPNTRVVLINFPNSPTGASIAPETLAALVALCRQHGLWLINDEVYRAIGSDLGQQQVADLYERGISVDALSKSFGMPGLRVGWIACRDATVLALAMNAKSGLSSCLARPSEVLAQMALRCAPRIIARNRELARANWSRLLPVLAKHGDRLEAPVANGGVLAFPRYVGPGRADEFAANLVREAGVLVLPSSLWRSPLATVAADHIRIGLGTVACAPAIAALDRYLAAA